MNAYFSYLQEVFVSFWKHFGTWWYDLIVGPWTKVGGNFEHYGNIFHTYEPSFGVAGWIFFVIFAILGVAAIGAACFGLYILIKKYVKFYKKELDKDALREQVDRLNYELYQAVAEKDRILGLQVNALGLKNPELDKKNAQNVIDEVSSRFPKLTWVDHQYVDFDATIPDIPDFTLEELCNRFRLFAASQLHLYYTVDTIRQLFAGMATSKLMILEGISGTGKTSMAYALGKFFQYDANICSVQPSWKDRSELIGYYNEFTKKFNETEFLRALYTATYRKDINIIVLDEMNLARIEYYFAEFLSVMEMPNINEWNIELINTYSNDDPKNVHNGKMLIPQNVQFFGTANNDDSTFTISDKVYDRAISLFFDNKGIAFDAEFTDPVKLSYDQFHQLCVNAWNDYPISDAILDKFGELDNFVIAKFKLAFGNRILKQMKSFVPAYVACGGTEIDAVDFIFTNKILKKFESLNVAFLRDELGELNLKLDELFGEGTFKMAHKYINNLLKMSA